LFNPNDLLNPTVHLVVKKLEKSNIVESIAIPFLADGMYANPIAGGEMFDGSVAAVQVIKSLS
jgi:hypothetical protein